jgi:hypothetical protein
MPNRSEIAAKATLNVIGRNIRLSFVDRKLRFGDPVVKRHLVVGAQIESLMPNGKIKGP